MKKVRNTLIVLMTVLAVNSFAVIHIVNYSPGNATDTCNVGDTIRFTNNSGVYNINAIFIDSSTTNLLPVGTGIAPGNFYDYVIPGSLTGGTHIYNLYLFGSNHSTGTFILPGAVTGISSFTNNEGTLKIYPNPVLNELRISSLIESSLKIFNFNGQLIFTTSITKGENKINTTSLPPGIYLVNTNNKSIRILKE